MHCVGWKWSWPFRSWDSKICCIKNELMKWADSFHTVTNLGKLRVLGKIWFLRYGPKCSRPVRLQDFYINYISRTKWWKSLIFFHVDIDSWKIEVDWKILGWACSKMGVTSKNGCMPRKNEWNKFIFGVLIQIHES